MKNQDETFAWSQTVLLGAGGVFALAVIALHKVGRSRGVGTQIASVAAGALLGVTLLAR